MSYHSQPYDLYRNLQAYTQPFLFADDGDSYIVIKAPLTDTAYLDVSRRG